MADSVSYVIFLDEHFVALENMSFPIYCLELRKHIKDTSN